jgi:hypothetical protein
MQITIEITDELAAKAEARGMTPERYVEALIEDAARTATSPLPPAKPSIDMKKFLREMAANSGKIPRLPDEAFTRESFYQDPD